VIFSLLTFHVSLITFHIDISIVEIQRKSSIDKDFAGILLPFFKNGISVMEIFKGFSASFSRLIKRGETWEKCRWKLGLKGGRLCRKQLVEFLA
jgi:hypothetical protein